MAPQSTLYRRKQDPECALSLQRVDLSFVLSLFLWCRLIPLQGQRPVDDLLRGVFEGLGDDLYDR